MIWKILIFIWKIQQKHLENTHNFHRKYCRQVKVIANNVQNMKYFGIFWFMQQIFFMVTVHRYTQTLVCIFHQNYWISFPSQKGKWLYEIMTSMFSTHVSVTVLLFIDKQNKIRKMFKNHTCLLHAQKHTIQFSSYHVQCPCPKQAKFEWDATMENEWMKKKKKNSKRKRPKSSETRKDKRGQQRHRISVDKKKRVKVMEWKCVNENWKARKRLQNDLRVNKMNQWNDR